MVVRKIRLRAFYFCGGRYAMSKKRQNYSMDSEILGFFAKKYRFFPSCRVIFFLKPLTSGNTYVIINISLFHCFYTWYSAKSENNNRGAIMTENNKDMQPASSEEELVLVLDGIYSEIAQDINAAKTAILSEVKYTAVQSQSVEKDLAEKLNEQISAIKSLANELKYSLQQNQAVHNDISETIHEEVSAKLDSVAVNEALLAEIDKAVQELEEKVSALDLDAVAERVLSEMPAAEEVDYDRIGDAISEKAEEVVSEHSKQILEAVASIPVAENVDYVRIVDEVGDRVLEIVQDSAANQTVEAAPVEIDYDRIVYETTEKVVESLPPVEKLDYEKLAEMVAAKLTMPAFDYDLLAEKVVEKLSAKEETAEVYIDGDGVQDIANCVAEKLADVFVCKACATEMVEETSAEETVAALEEVCEEAVPVVEEVFEAETELATAEVAIETVAEETPAIGLVDADSELVVRLKRSFTAKLKQSEDDIKGYYSVLKNALSEYKKINSNISWHGDRFNFGRDTVARITIIGKTLGLYLALDPADPEFKQTVYRQKDVSKQKAYEGTPFMVKIKSDGGLKKALRLVVALAQKLGTEKDEEFSTVDYVAMYPQATDEEMLEEGLIKATKEKKVALDF